MKEFGIVKKIISKNVVEVQMQRGSGCGQCTACEAMSDGTFNIFAKNEIGAQLGQRVEIVVSSSEALKISALVYILPVIFLFVGYILGFFLSKLLGFVANAEFFGIGIGFGFFVAGLFVVIIVDKKNSKQKDIKAEIIGIALN